MKTPRDASSFVKVDHTDDGGAASEVSRGGAESARGLNVSDDLITAHCAVGEDPRRMDARRFIIYIVLVPIVFYCRHNRDLRCLVRYALLSLQYDMSERRLKKPRVTSRPFDRLVYSTEL